MVDVSDVNILNPGEDLVEIVLEDSLNNLIEIYGNTVALTVSILGGAVTETSQGVLGRN